MFRPPLVYWVMHKWRASKPVSDAFAAQCVDMSLKQGQELKDLWSQHGLDRSGADAWKRVKAIYWDHVIVVTGQATRRWCNRWGLPTKYFEQMCLNCKPFNLHCQCEHFITVRALMRPDTVDLTKLAHQDRAGRPPKRLRPDSLQVDESELQRKRAKNAFAKAVRKAMQSNA